MPIVTPSRLAIFFMAIGIPLSLLVVAIAPSLWVWAFAGISAVLVGIFFDSALSPSARNLSASINAPATCFVGSDNIVTVTITSKSNVRPVNVQIKLETNDIAEDIPIAPLQGSGIHPFNLSLKRRGKLEIDAVWLRWIGPFHLTWKQVRLPLNTTRSVNPDIRTIQTDAIRLIDKHADFGEKSQLQRGDGTEFDAMREFVQGMDRRSLDWKASARHQTMMAKEFQSERNHNVVLAFDTGRIMCEPIDGISRLDHAVHASMLLSYASLRGGDRVGLYGFDARPRLLTGLVRGQNAFGRLQNEMANLEYSTLDANYTLGLTRLSSSLNRRSLIILFTDFIDTTQAELMIENAARLAKKHLLVFAVFQDQDLQNLVTKEPQTADDVSSAVVADGLLQERRLVQSRLKRLGIEVLEAPAETFSTQLLSRYLMLMRQERI